MNKLKAEVIKLVSNVYHPPNDPPVQPVREEKMIEFEVNTGITIPGDVKEWLRVANGPCIGAGGIYGITPRRKHLDMQSMLDIYPCWLENGWLPIGGDGCGNYYLVVTRQDFGEGEPVVFLETIDDATKATFIVASDTWHFLRFYLLDDLERTSWPFDKELVTKEDPGILNFKNIPLPWEVD